MQNTPSLSSWLQQPVSSSGRRLDKPNIATTSSAGAHSGQSSLSKISVAQVFLLLDSINEKEGKEKWETKAAQIHKVSRAAARDVYLFIHCTVHTRRR
jgi:CCR4-NOT transcription complex subunit 1